MIKNVVVVGITALLLACSSGTIATATPLPTTTPSPTATAVPTPIVEPTKTPVPKLEKLIVGMKVTPSESIGVYIVNIAYDLDREGAPDFYEVYSGQVGPDGWMYLSDEPVHSYFAQIETNGER